MKKRREMRCNLILILAVLSTLAASCGLLTGSGGSAAGKERLCLNIASRFDKTLANRKNTCVTYADCSCYNPVSKSSGCGGITDKVTADALGVIEKEFHEAGCPRPIRCAAWICSPVCAKGRCFNGN